MRAPSDSYIKLFRKIQQNPVIWDREFNRFQAWSWLLMNACWSDDGCLKRGEIIVGRRYLAEKWKWSEMKVWRFLENLKHKQMISTKVLPRTDLILKVSSKYDYFRTDIRTDLVPSVTIVTILKYDEYQCMASGQEMVSDTEIRTNSETDYRTDPDTVLNKKKEVKEVQRKKRASHDAAVLQEVLSGINMPDFFRKYEAQGLNVQACFDDFMDYVLHGSAKDPRPNPAGWTDLSKAFHDSCKRSLERGRFLLKSQPKRKSLSERLGAE